MRERQLQPIEVSPKYEKGVEKEITAFFLEEIFRPIIEEMENTQKSIFNSTSAIDSGIRTGKIQYADGIFKGQFSAAMSKEFRGLGMKFDKRIKGYRKELSKLPIPLQVAISQTASRYELMAANMINAIDKVDIEKGLESLSFQSTYGKVIDSVDSSFTKTVSKAIGITVDITEDQKKIIAKEFSNNLKLFIKDFADKEILLLRQKVEDAVFAGIRAESLQKVIKDRFNVSENKAKFLARQEINLLTSKYKQAKYQEAGVNKYRWSTSKDSRVRDGDPAGEGDHKSLDGKIFSFDDPPITNKYTGERNNPGEDYGCRCVAIPVIEV